MSQDSRDKQLHSLNAGSAHNGAHIGCSSRRQFLKTAACGSLLPVATLSWVNATAGNGYETISPAQQTSSEKGMVEVLEYFWFGCPHCYAFEPAINEWAASKPDYVQFVREAPPLNPGWKHHSEAFYASEQLGVTDTFFDAMFNAIHKERKKLRSRKEISRFAGELGIDAKEFLGAMKSFTVETRISQAMDRAMNSGINGVPAIVINGKYRTGNSLAGGHDGIIRVINELVEVEHKAS